MATRNEVATADKKELTMSGYFANELERISGALPANFNKQRFALNFISMIQEKPELQKFKKEVLATALVRSAQDGLDALNGEVYIYKGYGDNLTYSISYKGLRKMAIEKSVKPIKQIISKVVYEGDTLDEEVVNGESHLVYKSSLINKKNPIGVFALCTFTDGSELYEIMTKEETDKVKSKSRNSGAWKDFETEMMKKTAIRRLCKNITLNFSDKQQADAFTGADEFVSDAKEQAQVDIATNANQSEFNDDDVIEVDAETGQAVMLDEDGNPIG